MNENKLELSIVTPYGEIFSGFINSINLPGVDGEFGVLPNHCDLLSMLKAGVIEFSKEDDKKELVAINWGYVEVTSNRVDILANGAVSIKGNDSSSVSQNIERAKKLLQNASEDKMAISSTMARIEASAKQLL